MESLKSASPVEHTLVGPSVGNFYDVPCLHDVSGLLIPIIGPAHTDGMDSCITETPLHYHYDLRFIEDPKAIGIKVPGAVAYTGQEISLVRKQCFRTVSDNGHLLFAQLRLMERFQNHQLKCLTCPHKGLPLIGEGDIRKCPGHGLTWNIATGRLAFTPPYFLRLKGSQKTVPATTLGDLKINLPIDVVGLPSVELLDSEQRVISEFNFPSSMLIQPGDNLMITINCDKIKSS